MTTLLTTFRAKDSATAAQLSLVLADLQASTRLELGNKSYEVLVSEAEATTFYITESWDSKEHAELHAAHVAQMDLSSRLADWLLRPLETVSLRAL